MRRIGMFLGIIWAAFLAYIVACRRKGPAPVATPARLASRTIWALEDIIASAGNCRMAWSTAMGEAERLHNYPLVDALGRLSCELATIERKAIEARNGHYQER